MKTDIETLDWNVGKIYQSKDKEGRKTVDEVFDQTTLKHIQQLFSRGIISTIENIIAAYQKSCLQW